MTAASWFRVTIWTIAFPLLVFGGGLSAAEKTGDESEEKRDSSSNSLKFQSQSTSTRSQNALGSSPLSDAVTDGSLFRAGEWSLTGFGTGGFGQDTHNVTEERTVKETRIVSDTHLETRTVFRRVFVPPIRTIPGHFITVAVPTQVPVTTKHKVNTSHKVKTTKNVAGIQDGFGGVGAEARYFFTRFLGVGLEGDWLEGGNGSVGMTMTTFTARLIKDANAFYAFGGFGVQFDEHRSQTIGKLGLGIEHRLGSGTGLFADGAWMFGEHQDAAVFRAGVRLPLQ